MSDIEICKCAGRYWQLHCIQCGLPFQTAAAERDALKAKLEQVDKDWAARHRALDANWLGHAQSLGKERDELKAKLDKATGAFDWQTKELRSMKLVCDELRDLIAPLRLANDALKARVKELQEERDQYKLERDDLMIKLGVIEVHPIVPATGNPITPEEIDQKS